ncbi:DUF4166 domain-containing protein [Pyxidicoccus sp. MSG2]|uniref:DUF4166 domain-containing protein n=1 Tax=Pyxidicoccus sp. MSG2 TaxID=2996790 RepID=UPI00226E2843|nr:DUF4166 domain-containing protein [Pyxidicoccus sp. MSG2]MCY1018204.1 DUF4166 domain-containing protein [Pyxidicoccus sp. MSG2]
MRASETPRAVGDDGPSARGRQHGVGVLRDDCSCPLEQGQEDADEGIAAVELADARKWLPGASSEEALRAFVQRQRASRLAVALLADFYRAHPCRMARVHLLVASAVALGRFWGVSAPFARLGAAVLPVDSIGRPRTAAWASYARACAEGLPLEIRDERWIEAHLQDAAEAREAGHEAAFLMEARAHDGEPLWRLLVQHLEMTLGSRFFDQPALAGAVSGEAAMAHGMAVTLRRLLRAGWSLLQHYALATARAVLFPRWPEYPGLVDERRTAWLLLSSFVTAWAAAGVYRRGVRALHRGQRVGPAEAWPLLAATLGADVARVDPRVVRFYSNPGAWAVSASVELRTRMARGIAWVATRLLGQGVSEHGARAFPSRFRTFRRVDGSMHFVRELYCDGVLRVFDSDFVVRKGRLYEVFVEHGLEVELDVRVLEDGGVSLRGHRVRWHGLPVPLFGLCVEFRTHSAPDGSEAVDIIGTLSPKGMHENPLGRIHYKAWRDEVRMTQSPAMA